VNWMPDNFLFLTLVLRWVHFVGGVTWFGTIFYLDLSYFPEVQRGKATPLSRELVSRLNILLIFSSILSIVAGISLALVLSNLDTGVFTSAWGVSILVGGLFALGALVCTFAGVLPALDRLSGREIENDERNRIIAGARKWLTLAVVLGILVLLMMATAGSIA
jgi:uncharacterized membrane protein